MTVTALLALVVVVDPEVAIAVDQVHHQEVADLEVEAAAAQVVDLEAAHQAALEVEVAPEVESVQEVPPEV